MRVFLAFEVPADVGSTLIASLSHIGVETYQPENLHITLHFLGDITDAQVPTVMALVEGVAKKYGPIDCVPTSFAVADGRIRALVTLTPALLQLHGEVVVTLWQHGFNLALAPYGPHITLGRVGNADLTLPKMPKLSFEAGTVTLFQSEQGDDKMGQFTPIAHAKLQGSSLKTKSYKTIILPTRSQPDTLIAVYFLKTFGHSYFPGIEEATCLVMSEAGEQKMSEKSGAVFLDVGGGVLDHHTAVRKTTASELVACYLGVRHDEALAKLLAFAERDDFHGKGIISTDALDRAFGLPGLVANLNKVHAQEPQRVVDIILPIIDAHYREEFRRTREMPLEFEQKRASGEAIEFSVRQRKNKLRCVVIPSENPSLAGFLRSQQGGRFDVVIQRLPSGHTNILTRPTKRVDLRTFVAVVRKAEAIKRKIVIDSAVSYLSRSARLNELPMWYYDPATNSLQNGGLHPGSVEATLIAPEEFRKLAEVGLSGAISESN